MQKQVLRPDCIPGWANVQREDRLNSRSTRIVEIGSDVFRLVYVRSLPARNETKRRTFTAIWRLAG